MDRVRARLNFAILKFVLAAACFLVVTLLNAFAGNALLAALFLVVTLALVVAAVLVARHQRRQP